MADNEFIAKKLKRFKEIEDDESDLRDNFKECLKFTYGEQWDPKVKQDREKAGRPALTFNRLPIYVQKVSNEAREQKPQIKFNPRHDSDQEVAEVKEGIARQIQYESRAGIASETAVEYSAAASFGFMRLITEYCDDKSFDQDVCVVPVYDPLTVYGALVPAAFGQKPNDIFIIEDLPFDEFREQYPDSEIKESDDFSAIDPNATGWISTKTARVAECWYVERHPSSLYLLEDGTITEEDPKGTKKVKDERTIQKRVVKSCKMTAREVIKGTETTWAGDEIPVYPVIGGSKIIEGKPKLFSLVQWQMDAQRMINIGKTRIAETLATSPISPFIGVEGQFENHEAEWQTANTTLRPYLQYKPVSINGTPAPPPQRNTFEPPIQALSEFVAQEVDDLKATSGIFDQSLGSGTTDQSGIAIQRRQQQSDLTNLHFMDNLERAFQPMGRQLAKVIPIYYSTARVIKIVGPDEVQKMVKINQQHQGPNGPQTFDLSKGDDDIVVTMGRSFSSKRLESFDMMQSVVQAAPGTLNIIGDLMFRNSDIAGADQLADRFKRMLPPQAQDPDENQGQQQQQQMQQMAAQHQQLTEAVQQMHQIIETKQVEQQAKIQVAQMQEQSRQEIVKMQEATKLAVAQINASKDANQAFAEQELKQYQIMHDSAHDLAMQQHDQAHQQDMAAQAQQHQQGMAQQQAASQSDLSAQNAAQTQAQQEAAQEAQGAQQ